MLRGLLVVLMCCSVASCGGGGDGGTAPQSKRVSRVDADVPGGASYGYVYHYNDNGEQTTSERVEGGVVVSTTTYTVNAEGRKASSTSDTGANVVYLYDSADRLYRYEYDNDKDGSTDQAFWATFDSHGYRAHTYNDIGLDGSIEQHFRYQNTYDADGKLVSRDLVDAATDTTIASFVFTYGTDDLLSSFTVTDAGGVTTVTYTWETGEGNWLLPEVM